MKAHKQKTAFNHKTGFKYLTLQLSEQAVSLLSQTTVDSCGTPLSNHVLFHDLLARMAALPPETDGSTRISPGEARFSEPALSNDWNIGRTRLRTLLQRMEDVGLIATERTFSGSVMYFPSVRISYL